MESNVDDIKNMVRESYSGFIKEGSCCSSSGSCCGSTGNAKTISKSVGYSEDEMSAVPDSANLGFGCGNPTAIASIKEGETVLDLGSGAGLDAFLSAQKVGPKGKVIGVDMTPDMITKAKKNAEEGKYQNVEFMLGEIENLPVDDCSIDVIISNCVINLSPEKQKTFNEAYRVLKSGGRIMISDLVLKKELPKEIKESSQSYAACISGAVLIEEYLGFIKSAGFKDVKITKEAEYLDMKEYILSISVLAVK